MRRISQFAAEPSNVRFRAFDDAEVVPVQSGPNDAGGQGLPDHEMRRSVGGDERDLDP